MFADIPYIPIIILHRPICDGPACITQKSILAIHRLPQSQNNVVKYCVLQIRL
jgi:hypothetical protein